MKWFQKGIIYKLCTQIFLLPGLKYAMLYLRGEHWSRAHGHLCSPFKVINLHLKNNLPRGSHSKKKKKTFSNKHSQNLQSFFHRKKPTIYLTKSIVLLSVTQPMNSKEMVQKYWGVCSVVRHKKKFTPPTDDRQAAMT